MVIELLNAETCKYCQSCNPVKLKNLFCLDFELSVLPVKVYEGRSGIWKNLRCFKLFCRKCDSIFLDVNQHSLCERFNHIIAEICGNMKNPKK